MSFVKGGLRDLSISRTTFDWGVKVPDDPEHVMYVWVDALTNYITGVGFPDESDQNWRYWPADVHIIGKDIIRFHAVYWPAFLMSAGIPVQKRVYAHGFLFNRGEKMSKSVGNVVDPFNLADQYGVDQMRYFFLREVPFGQDGNYNHEAIVARINADLANDLGNLAQRSLSMIAKQLGGVLPEPGEFSDNDKAMLAQADGMLEPSRNAMATQQIHQWLNAVWAVVAEANRYFAGEAPWALAKTDPARQKTVLYVTAEVVRQIAILAQPVMPECVGKAARQPRHTRRCAQFCGAWRRDAHRARHERCRRRSACSRATSSQRPTERFERMLVDSHCHLDFPDFAEDLDGIVARARGRRHRPHRHDLDAGEAARRAACDRRALSKRLLLGRHPSAPRRRGRRHSGRRTDRADKASEGRGARARRGSTISMSTARARRRSAAFAPISPPPAPPACRW